MVRSDPSHALALNLSELIATLTPATPCFVLVPTLLNRRCQARIRQRHSTSGRVESALVDPHVARVVIGVQDRAIAGVKQA